MQTVHKEINLPDVQPRKEERVDSSEQVWRWLSSERIVQWLISSFLSVQQGEHRFGRYLSEGWAETMLHMEGWTETYPSYLTLGFQVRCCGDPVPILADLRTSDFSCMSEGNAFNRSISARRSTSVSSSDSLGANQS